MIEIKKISKSGPKETEWISIWKKTYETVIRRNILTPLPAIIPHTECKQWLKLLGITLEDLPDKWDLHFEEMMGKDSGRMYILRVCK